MLSWSILYNALVRLQTKPNNLTSITSIPGMTTRTEIGGSVAVTFAAFQEVGGYDSECFYGYSHEDRMFKLKLSTIHPMVQMNVTLHHMPHVEQVIHHSKMGSAISNYLHLHKDGVVSYIASTRNRIPQFHVCWNLGILQKEMLLASLFGELRRLPFTESYLFSFQIGNFISTVFAKLTLHP